MDELKGRLEVLLGAKPEAPVDETKKRETDEAARQAQRQRVSAAGGELLGAAFKFLGELVPQKDVPAPPKALVDNLRTGLSSCIEQDADGKPRLSVTLPDMSSLENLAQTLARLLAMGNTGVASGG
jgi:hypothetical protein